MIKSNVVLIAGAAALATLGAIFALKNPKSTSVVVVIGDVGGTNIRLTLRRLCLKTRTSEEIKPLTKIASQSVESFEQAIE